jgi:catechol 2,3-dioxygenase-like lactoylglutathione lyase family enzyme
VLHSSEVIAFVATTDSERARGFYEAALGLSLLRDEPFALVFDANGTTLRVQKVRALDPAPYTVLGWKVPDVRATVSSLAARGFERYPGLMQDDPHRTIVMAWRKRSPLHEALRAVAATIRYAYPRPTLPRGRGARRTKV